MPRQPIAALADPNCRGPLRLAGRVLAIAVDRLRLADQSGSAEIVTAGLSMPAAGDLVELEVRREGEGWRAESIGVVSPCRLAEPFPSPGGEYYRLHRGPTPRMVRLGQRARLLRALRSFFDGRGYLEVQTPQLVRTAGLEPHLRALPADDGFLITSPEYQMKRLLAGGLEQIYFLGACWRGEELGHQHLREFTMLEWYRAWSSLDELMTETEELVAELSRVLRGTTAITYQGRQLDLTPPFLRLTVAEALRQYAGIDIRGVTSAAELRRRAVAAGLGPFDGEEAFDAVASRILVELVEPALAAQPRPVLLHDFPAPLAALSRLKPEDLTVAERFELYAGGLELANAFGELTDPDEQRRRLEQDQAARVAAGAPVYPLDQRFLSALAEGMPPAAGIALGVDRLLMLLIDASDIRQVVTFASDEL